MNDKEVLAQYISTEIHGEDDYVSVYGSAIQGDGDIYIEGDIDGEGFAAVLSIKEIHLEAPDE